MLYSSVSLNCIFCHCCPYPEKVGDSGQRNMENDGLDKVLQVLYSFNSFCKMLYRLWVLVCFVNGEGGGLYIMYFPNVFVWPVSLKELISSKTHFGIHCFILTDKIFIVFIFVKVVLILSISPAAILIWSVYVVFKILSFENNPVLIKWFQT